MKKRVRGSLTIEAAVIVPMILWMFAIIILLLLYFHDKNVITAIAHETVSVSCDNEEICENVLKDYFRKRLSGKLLLFPKVNVEVTVNEKSVFLECSAKKRGMKLRTKVKMKMTKPEQYVRKLRRVET